MRKLSFLVVLLAFAGLTLQAQQRLVMIEEFTSSTCPPCAPMNAWLNPLLVTNADKVVVVKYQMNWPAQNGFPNGDPYYTAEGGVRRTYYGVNAVPDIYINGAKTGTNQSAVQNAINNAYAQPAQATITGGFKVVGNMIYVEAYVTPSISGANHRILCTVNEKTTYGNVDGNGETVFYHIMMKMLPNGGGTTLELTAGETIPLQFSYDMSTTHVEEMNDLEVTVFVQNVSTKAMLNAAYLTENNITLPLPPSNFTAAQQGETLNVDLSWTAVTGASGYNVYKDGVKLNSSPVTGTTYSDVAAEYGVTYNYGVSAIVGGTEGFQASANVFTDITIPLPIITTVKQIRGKEMFIEWELPGFEHPIKYFVYRSNIVQNPGNPTSETSMTNTGLSYREYCFEIEPVLNAITGSKSSSVCIDLLDVPQPKNLKAEQVAPTLKEVLLTWTASTTNTAGYNIYRDGVLLNTELVIEPTYTDVVDEYGVEYSYKVYGVASTGAESEKSGDAKITLSDSEIPAPENVKAEQQGTTLNVLVEWDAVDYEGVTGYNVYRDGEQINTDLVEETEYLDNVPEPEEYCYTVTAVVADEEGQFSQAACVDVTSVGICNINKDAMFSLYPNPVSGTLNINTQETITECQIFNMQGQLIYSAKSNVREIATDGWATGMYIIRITTDKGSAEKRFVKN